MEICQGAPRRHSSGEQGRRGQGKASPLASWCHQSSCHPLLQRSSALASLAICSHRNCSVATEWGWHCSGLCVLPFLPRSGPWAVKNSAAHSSWLASSSERQVPQASGRICLSDTTLAFYPSWRGERGPPTHAQTHRDKCHPGVLKLQGGRAL